MAVIQFTPGTSTVAVFKTTICNLRDYDTSRTERQVNAFHYVVIPSPIPASTLDDAMVDEHVRSSHASARRGLLSNLLVGCFTRVAHLSIRFNLENQAQM